MLKDNGGLVVSSLPEIPKPSFITVVFSQGIDFYVYATQITVSKRMASFLVKKIAIWEVLTFCLH